MSIKRKSEKKNPKNRFKKIYKTLILRNYIDFFDSDYNQFFKYLEKKEVSFYVFRSQTRVFRIVRTNEQTEVNYCFESKNFELVYVNKGER